MHKKLIVLFTVLIIAPTVLLLGSYFFHHSGIELATGWQSHIYRPTQPLEACAKQPTIEKFGFPFAYERPRQDGDGSCSDPQTNELASQLNAAAFVISLIMFVVGVVGIIVVSIKTSKKR